MRKRLPSVDFVVCTFNSGATIRECLDSIKRLDYPKHLVKAIVIDGGSTDGTLTITSKYKFCRIHQIVTNGPEEATAIGYNLSKADFVVNYPSDNILTSSNWLKRMVAPLVADKTLVAAETLRYAYNKKDKPLNKYFALFGMNDPVAFYLGKRDRAAYFESGWHLKSHAHDRGDYFETVFNKNNLPTVGANGFIVRTKAIQKVTKDPKKFSHIDSCVDLLNLGYNRYAFVKTDIWHKSGERFSMYFSKRKKYVLTLYFKKQTMRRYHLYNPKTDKVKLGLFVVYALTFAEPTVQSVRGYIKVRDFAWFLHPLICFAITITYIYTLLLFRAHIWRNTLKARTA